MLDDIFKLLGDGSSPEDDLDSDEETDDAFRNDEGDEDDALLMSLHDADADEEAATPQWEDDEESHGEGATDRSTNSADDNAGVDERGEGTGADMLASGPGFGGSYAVHEANWKPGEFRGVGDPVGLSRFWQRQQGDTCALMAQANVYESLTGHRLNEAEIVQFAQANGWYLPGRGTRPEALGSLLEGLGVLTAQYSDATLADIAQALQREDRVIVWINANEVWRPLRDVSTDMPVEQAFGSHIAWVTGLGQYSDGSWRVILNDSGSPDGRIEAVDALDFLNAWSNSGNRMIVAGHPREGV